EEEGQAVPVGLAADLQDRVDGGYESRRVVYREELSAVCADRPGRQDRGQAERRGRGRIAAAVAAQSGAGLSGFLQLNNQYFSGLRNQIPVGSDTPSDPAGFAGFQVYVFGASVHSGQTNVAFL